MKLAPSLHCTTSSSTWPACLIRICWRVRVWAATYFTSPRNCLPHKSQLIPLSAAADGSASRHSPHAGRPATVGGQIPRLKTIFIFIFAILQRFRKFQALKLTSWQNANMLNVSSSCIKQFNRRGCPTMTSQRSKSNPWHHVLDNKDQIRPQQELMAAMPHSAVQDSSCFPLDRADGANLFCCSSASILILPHAAHWCDSQHTLQNNESLTGCRTQVFLKCCQFRNFHIPQNANTGLDLEVNAV